MANKDIENAGFDPIGVVHDLGIRRKHAYLAGFASIGIALKHEG